MNVERFNEHKKTSRSPSGRNYCSLFANGEHLDLRQDVFVFVCVGKEGLRVRAERDDVAVVGTRKIHRGKNHLTCNTASFKAVKDAGMINDHPLWSGALVRHFAHLHRVGTCTFFGGTHPCFKNAVLFGLLVLNSYHSCFVLAFKSLQRYYIFLKYTRV